MNPYQEFLQYTIFDISVETYLYAIGVFAVTYIGLKIFQVIVLKYLTSWAKRTTTELDDEIIDVILHIRPQVYTLVSLFVGYQTFGYTGSLHKFIQIIFLTLLTWEVIQVLQRLIMFGIRLSFMKSPSDADKNEPVIRNISFLIKVTLWSIGFLMILSNFGVNITSLVAGLGVGGVAVALAAQNVLSDLFSSFSIYFDKPFEIGDFIVIGEDSGVVKEIGLKTTRLQTLQGEELVVANKELTDTRIQNFKKLEKRRVVIDLGLSYETPNEKLKRIPELLKGIIETVKDAELDRVHLKEFGDYSLKFQLVYFHDSADYYEHMDTLQSINFAILNAFEKEGLVLAYPTQTVLINK